MAESRLLFGRKSPRANGRRFIGDIAKKPQNKAQKKSPPKET
jgi:hypothetical protein